MSNRLKVNALVAAAVLAATVLSDPLPAMAASCESLTSLKLPAATITLAQPVAAGAFTLPAGGRGAPQQFEDLPAFCRLAATLRPTSDSDIKIEVWLPAAGWNGKFQAVGNGGWAGSIAYPAMIEALRRGYATSSTDTGHQGGGGSFALGHPEKLIDYGYRSEHEMTVVAKKVIETFYGNGPRYSYWNGCSAGGKQALMEAQRFPGDYDGIIAGAPALDWTGRAAQSLRVWQALHKDQASYIPPAKYPHIQKAVLQKCDASDGVQDGVLENPAMCRFDPAVLVCKAADDGTCLTEPQVEAARQIYSGAINPRSKREITGLQPGSERGWGTWGGAQPFGTSLDHFRYVVFKDPDWDPRSFKFESDVVLAEQIDNGTINALNPSLKPFMDRGGKLIQYHGWSDPQISPGASVQYYRSVVDALGGSEKVHSSYRLFMVPGMAHCGGGDGPNSFNMLAAIEQWVEQGKAPDQVVASRTESGRVQRTRPLCPYPQVAVYKGTGSTDEASNFVCK